MKAAMAGWLAAALLTCGVAFAQEQEAAVAPLKPEELEQLVAPIALYPDALLSQVLIASTYPLEVVMANRWVQANGKLAEDAKKSVLEKEDWDPSVKSLTNTPSVLGTMSDKLDWTQKLGDAVLAQQPDVMDAVQRLRAKAYAQKTLETTPQQTVQTTTVENKEVIIIESAQPNTVYVPYYDSTVVYGAWAYPAYPPVYYPPPPGYALARGIAFGTGIAIANAIWNNNNVNWGHGDINIDIDNNFNRTNIGNNRPGGGGGGTQWKHDPAHRHGVQYGNSAVQQKFGGNSARAGGGAAQMDFRGRDGKQVIQPSGGANRTAGVGQGGSGTRQERSNYPSGNRGNNASPSAGNSMRHEAGGGRNDNAFADVGNGKSTRAQADRGRASFEGGGGGGGARAGGGAHRRR